MRRPKKYVNGLYLEMTPEEIAEMQAAMESMPEPAPTPEERITQLEEELRAAKILLGLEA